MKRRRTFDNQGKPVSEVKTRDGYFTPELDTATISALKADQLAIEDTARMRQPDFAPSWKVRVGTNPYDGGNLEAKKLKARSKLDYMRALSEEIKKRRQVEAASGEEGAAAEGLPGNPTADKGR